MDSGMLIRLGAVVFVALALTVAAIEMTREEEQPARSSVRLLPPERDPLREGRRWCQQLGEAAAHDPGCLRVWAETRDRFLGRESAPARHPGAATADPTPERETR